MFAIIPAVIMATALAGAPSRDAMPAALAPPATIGAIVQVAQADSEPTPPAQISSGLPERPTPPRTMEAYWPVFAAFSIFWIGIMAYVLSFAARIRRVAESMTGLGGERAEPPEGVVR